MKFVVAVVMLALAVGVHSSLVGLGPWGAPAAISVQATNPWGLGVPGILGGVPAISLAAGPRLGLGLGLGLGPLGLPLGSPLGLWGGIPGISLNQGIAAAPLAHGGEGVYVAKTRGAIHTAPLAGHLQSATSVNVAPAPGTL